MDFHNELPIYQQIMTLIKTEIVSGKIPKGEKLLSTRDLAVKLKVNPNTIQRVYRELEGEAVCLSKRGLGTFVTEDDEVILTMREMLVDEMVKNFIKGMIQLNYSEEEIIQKLNNQLSKKGAN